MLMDQKQLCDSMIDEKNKLINDFKQVICLYFIIYKKKIIFFLNNQKKLTDKSDIYVKALKKYAEDIDLLIERMKDQITNMKKFYMEEIVAIEVSL
jgi:hypothetical protein